MQGPYSNNTNSRRCGKKREYLFVASVGGAIDQSIHTDFDITSRDSIVSINKPGFYKERMRLMLCVSDIDLYSYYETREDIKRKK